MMAETSICRSSDQQKLNTSQVVDDGNVQTVLDLALISGFDWRAGNSRKNEKHSVSTAESEQVFFNSPLLLLDDVGHSHQGCCQCAGRAVSIADQGVVKREAARAVKLAVDAAGNNSNNFFADVSHCGIFTLIPISYFFFLLFLLTPYFFAYFSKAVDQVINFDNA